MVIYRTVALQGPGCLLDLVLTTRLRSPSVSDYFSPVPRLWFQHVRGVHFRVSVHCNTFRQLHHHRGTVVQVCVKVPAKLLGQVSFELLCSFTQCSIYTRPTGKLEKVL